MCVLWLGAVFVYTQACVFACDVSAGTMLSNGYLVYCVCVVTCVSIWSAHDLPRIVFRPITVFHLNTHPPWSPAPSTLFKTLKATLLPLFLSSSLLMFAPAARQSAEHRYRTVLTLHDCAHVRMYKSVSMLVCTQGDEHETAVSTVKVHAECGQMTFYSDLFHDSVKRKVKNTCPALD